MHRINQLKQKQMKTKHTQGKWELSHGANTFPTIGSVELHQAIATVHKIEKVKGFCEEAEANAKLIAAAPELLEALIRVIEDREFDNNSIPQSTINKVKNAIKKATE